MTTELTELLHATMPLCATLGVRGLSMSPEQVEAEIDWAPALCTSGGVLHGGTLMAVADSIGAACAMANLPEGAGGTATIESKTNFLGAVTEGTVRVVARPLHAGRRTVVVETELHAGDRLVAKTTQTQAVL